MAEMSTFELYKLLIEEVRETRRARRDLSNTFMTLNLAGVGALGFLASQDGEAGLAHPALLFWCCVALVLTCVIWRTSNTYYRQILAAKYQILYEVEARLDASPLKSEWERLRPKKPNRTFFSLEFTMPALFVIGYVVFLAYQVTWAEFVALLRAAVAPLTELLHL